MAKSPEKLEPKIIEKRFASALARALSTPHKPHKPLKSKAKKTAVSRGKSTKAD